MAISPHCVWGLTLMSEKKRKIAILGGGVGAMTAAFALASSIDAKDRFEITVYQMGWRLGGKGASGRNAAQGQRIEEHGLHVWSGFYDNAIAQIRQVFAELQGEPGVFQSFETAFVPHNDIMLTEPDGSDWKTWVIRPPILESVPGSGGPGLTPLQMFKAVVAYVKSLIEQTSTDPGAGAHVDPVQVLSAAHQAQVRGRVGARTLQPTLHHWLHALTTALPDDPAAITDADKAALVTLTREVHLEAQARAAIRVIASDWTDDLRRLHMTIDLGAAAMRGIIADDVPFAGFAAVDDQEFCSWIASHGATQDTIDGALVKAVYDYAFGYKNGQTDKASRSIGAGTFLHGSIRLALTYKGAIFYKMNAGMGDTVFAPYHKALKKLGVRFRFFNKVTDLHLDSTASRIDRIGMLEQAQVQGEYDPYVRVGALDCWPSEPVWDRLTNGAAIKAAQDKSGLTFETSDAASPTHVLQRGVDFDDVVLGISIGSLPELASELVAADPAWRDMLAHVDTVATQAMQLWLRPDITALGGPKGQPIVTAFADAMNTVADMSHVIPAEAWGPGMTPGTIAYFCGPLAESTGSKPVSDTSQAWMKENGHKLLPLAFGADGMFKQDMLIADLALGQTDPWSDQYFRSNTTGSERYVLSVPGSARYRLRADRSGFANLWLAGDWTLTGINAGCVEAAAMSGLRAAYGLMGEPAQIAGEAADPITPEPGKKEAADQSAYPAPVLRTLVPQNSNWPWSVAYGMAQTTGAAVTLPFPRDTVAAMLPAGLQLMPQTVTAADQHPVILLFARQRNVRPNLFPFGMSYNEFICAVPWVRHTDPAMQDLPPLICPTVLYLNSLAPILLGVYGYGFNKIRTSITADGGSYIIRDQTDQSEIIACSFAPDAAQTRPRDLPLFSTTWPAWEMPMVTRNKLGAWQYSVYDFSLAQARMQPVTMEIRVTSPRLGLPVGALTVPSIATSASGGFFLTAAGTINNPFQSAQLLRQMRQSKSEQSTK